MLSSRLVPIPRPVRPIRVGNPTTTNTASARNTIAPSVRPSAISLRRNQLRVSSSSYAMLIVLISWPIAPEAVHNDRTTPMMSPKDSEPDDCAEIELS